MTGWIAKHTGHILLVGGVFTVLLAGLTIWLILREGNVETQIPTIQRIGSPCRSAFKLGLEARGIPTNNPMQQAMYGKGHPRSPQARALREMTRDVQCRDQAALLSITCPTVPLCGNLVGPAAVRRGVGVQNGNTSPSQQPGPSGGQQTPPQRPSAPVSQPPATPNPSPPPTLLDPVCDAVDKLGVPLC